ncbi:MAG: ATP-binding cassette domain-containing protein [Thermoanaerobaculaceae bacterium]|nr:ATP-binding cassette domain-containing protein [Thermoanaerobaculaceae bacterium]
MKIEKISILGGKGKNGKREAVREVVLEMGQVMSIVGPTGSGKTELINDIELFANGNTPSGRKILINNHPPSIELTGEPSNNPVALITQHTNFLSDLPVRKFLETHASVRHAEIIHSAIEKTLEFANQLTGEPINEDSAMTELSGGQTRALLIADAVVIGNAPILLLDEIENAGINRTRAIDLLKCYQKIFIFVTHDPRIALFSDFRIVMKEGAMQRIIRTDAGEQKVAEEIRKFDDLLLDFRAKIRAGETLTEVELEKRLRALGYLTH